MSDSSLNDDILASGVPATREISVERIRQMGWLFGTRLAERGYAHVVLEPDDGTRYEVMACSRDGVMGGAPYYVASNLSKAYPWNGEATIHPDYAAEKWSDQRNEWTGVVMALFLNWAAESLLSHA